MVIRKLELLQSFFKFQFSFSFCSTWHHIVWKDLYAFCPASQQFPQGCPRSSANVCLVEHRFFLISEGGMLAASTVHSFLQTVNAVMLWPVHIQKVPQASKNLSPAKLQTRCVVCRAFQSICPFILSDFGVSRVVDPQKSLKPKTVHGHVAVGAAQSILHCL